MPVCTKHIPLLIALLVFFPCVLWAQTGSDKETYRKKLLQARTDSSRALLMLDYGGTFAYENYDSAEFYYQQAKELSLKIRFYRGYQKYISYQAEILNLKGLFDSTTKICREGLALAEKKKDFLFQGTHLSSIGNVFLYKGNNDSAAWYFLRASRAFEAAKDSVRLGQLYSNLSIVFDNLGQYSQSLVYNRLALAIARATNDELSVGYAFSNIGAVLKKQGWNDSAAWYFRNGLPIASKFGDMNLKRDLLVNLGFIESDRKQYPEAEAHFLEALAISKQLKNDYGIVYSNKGLASIRIRQKNFGGANRLLDEAIAISTANGFREELQDLYLLKYEAAKENGNFKEALEAYQKHTEMRDSLINIEVQKNIALLEKQYQAERKEKMLLQKDNEIRSKNILLQTKNTWLVALSVLAMLLGLIVFLVRTSYQQKQAAAAREQKFLQIQLSMQAKEEERNRIARELHDDLGGTLSGIIVHTHFMIEQVEENNRSEIRKSIDKIHDAASEMITKLYDIVWLINPKYDTLEKLVQRIEEFALDMTRAKGMSVKINSADANDSVPLDTQARKNIYLICKEAINNAVKYSDGSELTLNILRSGANLRLCIEDNGKGFDEAAARAGNGLINMKERAKDIGAAYSLHAAGSRGTKVSIDYKIPQ